ncbi:MAG: hypothetical protein KBG20_10985 [Caldilineaceae bacterium]|nr:hypothetical protein [Caldilineaceae bacterium]MBP8107213.1 hypothetical protein [Caldilineaceae bacterium]MBP8122248.1 hypothetical protein [Caldilineaceae bacterium]MBP9072819.1 hypothetical protein [Caldilineaceae bacterium]
MNSQSTNPPINQFTLSVADYAITLDFDHAGLAKAVAERYAAFATDRPAGLRLRVDLVGQERDHAMLDQGMAFVNGRLRFDAPGYVGFIDEEAGTGQLAISSRQPVEEVDYFLRVAAALLLFREGGFMFHAAGIVRDGRAWLYFGYSGSGKTTVSRLSHALGDTILNDDLLFLLPRNGGWTVHSSPFWNPTQVKPNGLDSAPLAGLFRLVQAKTVFTVPMQPGQAVAELVASVPVLGLDPGRTLAILARCQRLSREVPVHHLHFLPDASFWPVVLAATAPVLDLETP